MFDPNWTWQPGWCCSDSLPVVGGGAELPVTLICGSRPGPTVLISAGVHCAEYVGIQAVIELSRELREAELWGSVLLLPVMNPTGFSHRTMSTVYEDQKNLNRVFPGRADGTLADRIAYTGTRHLFSQIDAYIDLHSGDGYEELTPFVFCQGKAEPAVAAKSRAMAELADVPYLIPSPTISGGAYNHAGNMGIPGILIERGGLGIWRREEVEADKQDVLRILHHLGVWKEPLPIFAHLPFAFEQIIYEFSNHTGCWYPSRHAGSWVYAGEVLGVVGDWFGNTLQVCRACGDGVVLYQTKSLSILENGPMIGYGLLPAEAREKVFSPA